MSTCSNWLTTIEIGCKDAGSKLDYECTTWADEGSNQCSQWADEGSNECTSWEECHWYTPWNCIAGFFCRAYYWVAKWVCLVVLWVAKWVCKTFAWVWVHIFCGLVLWGILWPAALICLGFTEIKCALVALGKWVSPGSRPPQIEHVFVLYLENRSFDHVLGFSGIRAVDVNGQPTSFNEGFIPNSVTNNINPYDNQAVSTSSPAEYYLSGKDLDPGHEFQPTLTALCGDNAHLYDKTTGAYPPIDNSGFVLNYSQTIETDILGNPTKRVTDPTRVMHCFGSDQLPVLDQLAREFAFVTNGSRRCRVRRSRTGCLRWPLAPAGSMTVRLWRACRSPSRPVSTAMNLRTAISSTCWMRTAYRGASSPATRSRSASY